VRNAQLLTLSLDEVTRADLALARALSREGYSRRSLKARFEAGDVQINGRRARAADLLPPGEHRVELGSAHDPLAFAQASSRGSFLEVLYEDEDLLVLNKESGVPSVPHSADETETAVGSALAHFPKLITLAEPSKRLEPGLLHRLDTGTSGILVFAKTSAEQERLKSLWKTPAMTKTYRAVCEARGSVLPRVPQTLTLTLAHDAKSSRRMRVIDRNTNPGARATRGRPLETVTELLQVSRITDSPSPGSSKVDFEVRIQTGVMHQIRCTLAHLGFPVLGDPVYGAPALGSDPERLWLHHWRFTLPLRSGAKPLTIEAPLPEGWPRSSEH
jgi:23S rRNA pseudouridine1911/1915/1917 synthase